MPEEPRRGRPRTGVLRVGLCVTVLPVTMEKIDKLIAFAVDATGNPSRGRGKIVDIAIDKLHKLRFGT